MLFRSLALAALLGSGLPPRAQSGVDFDWLAYAHLAAARLEERDDGVAYDTERLRFRSQVNNERLSGVVQIDAAVPEPGDDRPGTLPNGILDLYLTYRISDALGLVFGQFKTPIGMDFNRSPVALDLTKRGPDTTLTLNRDLGLMLTGAAGTSGLGFDVGVFNTPGRSFATAYSDAQVGEDYAAAARLRFDRRQWHAEIAHGQASNAGGPATRTYDTTDIGLSYEASKWLVRAEAIEGDHVRGEDNRRERVYYLHGTYVLNPVFELVARHYKMRSVVDGAATGLRNTYLGFTARLLERDAFAAHVRFNYVIAGGDGSGYTGPQGLRDDAVLLQIQILTRRVR
jgi:hypothetical protein